MRFDNWVKISSVTIVSTAMVLFSGCKGSESGATGSTVTHTADDKHYLGASIQIAGDLAGLDLGDPEKVKLQAYFSWGANSSKPGVSIAPEGTPEKVPAVQRFEGYDSDGDGKEDEVANVIYFQQEYSIDDPGLNGTGDAGFGFHVEIVSVEGYDCKLEPDSGTTAEIGALKDPKNSFKINSTCTTTWDAGVGSVKGHKGDVVVKLPDDSMATVKPGTTLDEAVDFAIPAGKLTEFDGDEAKAEDLKARITEVFTSNNVVSDGAVTRVYTAPELVHDSTKGLGHAVEVVTAPKGQICTVTPVALEWDSTYKGTKADASSRAIIKQRLAPPFGKVEIVCADDPNAPTETTYELSVVVSGMTGGTLQLRNNINLDPLTITEDGTYKFSEAITANDGYDYDVRILAQPAGQTCTLAEDVGTASQNVTVTATCEASAPTTYTVGGTVNGIPATESVTLELTYGASNTTEPLTVSWNPINDPNFAFSFLADLATGTDYSIAITAQPDISTTCTVNSGGSNNDGTGTIGTSNVSDITINCL